MQGGKDKKCPFNHVIEDDKGSRQRDRGNLIQLQCSVKFHWFLPMFIDGKPTTNQMAIICYGEHQHPPPPRKIPLQVKEKFIKAVQVFGVHSNTVRRLIASPILPIMLNGKTIFEKEHVTLANQDVINYLIRKEKIKEYPMGTDFQGKCIS